MEVVVRLGEVVGMRFVEERPLEDRGCVLFADGVCDAGESESGDDHAAEMGEGGDVGVLITEDGWGIICGAAVGKDDAINNLNKSGPERKSQVFWRFDKRPRLFEYGSCC